MRVKIDGSMLLLYLFGQQPHIDKHKHFWYGNYMSGMSPSPYHFEPHFTPQAHFSPYAGSPIAPHASQFHAPSVPRTGDTMFQHYQPNHAQQMHAAAPTQHQPGNRYAPDAELTNVTTHEHVGAGKQLKIGDVVEVTRGGHTELAYVNANNQLKQIDQAVINRVPPELRSHIMKIGGPSYFAHEIHNRIATQGLSGQFKSGDNRGPNRPLI